LEGIQNARRISRTSTIKDIDFTLGKPFLQEKTPRKPKYIYIE